MNKAEKMDMSTFNDIVRDQVDKCLDTLLVKGAEYANPDDRLVNFRIAASMQGVSILEAIAGMRAKHTVSVYEMSRAQESFSTAQWEEKIGDEINYLLLLKAAIVEQNQMTDAHLDDLRRKLSGE